ncbi:YeeE/YedE family protein [Aureliella helgolandensis]|uniref:Putative inner membrane protein n=1 Tax=Aureliella helgolandensis TaxID=2527968 RepID=A0A518GD13_9BACT|nr:YeeE/YedE thiosulfate transporter family protein [Aureliella helgolandensis]QDV26486.1 putative inner membrane protein [Aureliella helgolandensis]
MNWIMHPWPWWLSGILIGLTVPLLYILAGKAFGISTSLQEAGALCAPNSKLEYLSQFDRKGNLWTIVFAVGIGIGAFLATQFASNTPMAFLPNSFHSVSGAVKLVVGGFLIGFGTRYAGGCTSGHSITGISNLNWPSLVATIFFFVGGLSVTWGLGHLIFQASGQ